jgi:LacI family transcriptional regulator
MAEMTEQLETAPGRRGRATIREIADLAGVSIATVSRVVNGRGDVSDETRELVQRVVREHGYSANRSARGLSGGRTGLIGGTVPMLHYPYFSHVLFGVSEALYEQDMRLVLCPTMHEHEREVTLLERLLHGTTDGAVIILPEETSDELEQLLNHGYRFVVIDPQQPLNERIPAVSAAHTAGAAQAMDHLLSLGHRRIGAITGPRDGKATADRRRGYYAALGEAGIAPDPTLEIESNFELPGGAAAAERLLSLPEPPTAIFAFNDNMAIGTMQVARARGIRVPEELSIIGFDDLDEASIVNPALTTNRQPLAEMGRIAVSLLTRLLDDQRLEALHVELATRLVVRESTAARQG